MSIKVSILIPVYKSEKFIEKCLCSVFKQTYDNIEYIIVDDASPDNSMEVIMHTINNNPRRKASVHIIQNEKNQGIAYTRNTLLEHSTGDYVYFVDSDDFIDHRSIETFVAIAHKDNADIVRCNYYNYCNKEIQAILRKPINEEKDYIKDCLTNEIMNSLWLLFISKRIIVNQHLMFPTNINGCEDLLMTIKLFYYADIISETPIPLYYYRLDNDNSLTHNEKSFKNDFCLAIKEIYAFLKEKQINEQYKKEILNLMFISKQNFLLNKEIRDIDKYINTFPESSKCYKAYDYSIKDTILFYLAEHHYINLLKFITSFL